jgi:hypothetical protein
MKGAQRRLIPGEDYISGPKGQLGVLGDNCERRTPHRRGLKAGVHAVLIFAGDIYQRHALVTGGVIDYESRRTGPTRA